jgi:LmbE family N-acetylglucosaminyl deacetylase
MASPADFFSDSEVDRPMLMVTAHPDDELIGAGGQMHRWRNLAICCVTNGSPAALEDARHAGFTSAAEYERARKEEMFSALALAQVSRAQVYFLDFGDQQTAFQLKEITLRLAGLIERLQPEMILTHPYEGGHPDHDSVAFAVQNACWLAGDTGSVQRNPWEFSCYFNLNGCFQCGAFLESLPGEIVRYLSPAERELKRKMFDCHRSQSRTLAGFDLAAERFRPAPTYDFSKPPQGGQLYYEMFPWGMDGRRWRELAGEALRELQGMFEPFMCP